MPRVGTGLFSSEQRPLGKAHAKGGSRERGGPWAGANRSVVYLDCKGYEVSNGVSILTGTHSSPRA